MIEVKNLSFSYKNRAILSNLSFCINEGENLAILGENGCGKSTLLKCILNLLKFKGEILINGKNLLSFSRKNLARIITYIPQFQNSPFEYKVIDIVLMGRLAHKNLFESYSKNDYKISLNALEKLEILHLKDRIFSNLSGGEKQLVYIARSFASEAKIIFMDEPVSGLDFGNQIKLLSLIKMLSNDGYTVIITSHHPRHIQFLNSKVLMIKNGTKFKQGNAEILSIANISALYEIDYSKFKEIL